MKSVLDVTKKKLGRTNLFELELERRPTVDTKEVAHAIAGERVGTAVVLLVGVQPGSPTRGVRREHRGPDQPVSLPRRAVMRPARSRHGAPTVCPGAQAAGIRPKIPRGARVPTGEGEGTTRRPRGRVE